MVDTLTCLPLEDGASAFRRKSELEYEGGQQRDVTTFDGGGRRPRRVGVQELDLELRPRRERRGDAGGESIESLAEVLRLPERAEALRDRGRLRQLVLELVPGR